MLLDDFPNDAKFIRKTAIKRMEKIREAKEEAIEEIKRKPNYQELS